MKDSPKPLAAPTAAPPPKPSLDDLAKRINREHAACARCARVSLRHALRAGDLLREAKALCSRGTWLAWLAKHFLGSVRTAEVYVQVSRHRKALEAQSQHAANWSLRAALVALPKTRPTKPARPEAPEDRADDLGDGSLGMAYRVLRREIARVKLDGFERVPRATVQRHLRLLARMVGEQIEASEQKRQDGRLVELVEKLVTLANTPLAKLPAGDLRETARGIHDIVLGSVEPAHVERAMAAEGAA